MRRDLVARDFVARDITNNRLLAIRSWVLALSAVAAIVIGAVLGAPVNAAVNPSEAFVQSNIDKGYAILNNSALSAQARRDQFRQFLLTLTDLKRIAAFTLGPAARTASESDKAAFYDAFEDYAVAVYDVHLSKYRGQTLKVTGSQERSADDVVVNADVVNPAKPDAEPVKVAFRVRKAPDGHLIVTDMQVEGVWLSISERADFESYLQQHGNSVSSLIAHLKTAAQKIEASGRMPDESNDSPSP